MAKLQYDVEISNANNGLIVRVGCKTIVAKDNEIDDVFEDLKQICRGGYKAATKLRKKYGIEDDEVPQVVAEERSC